MCLIFGMQCCILPLWLLKLAYLLVLYDVYINLLIILLHSAASEKEHYVTWSSLADNDKQLKTSDKSPSKHVTRKTAGCLNFKSFSIHSLGWARTAFTWSIDSFLLYVQFRQIPSTETKNSAPTFSTTEAPTQKIVYGTWRIEILLDGNKLVGLSLEK